MQSNTLNIQIKLEPNKHNPKEKLKAKDIKVRLDQY